jgi:proteasome lid subunit RPN8/RPN11
MQPHKQLPVVIISDSLLIRTANLLASFAAERETEGVVYWLGIEAGMKAVVTTLAVPDADTRYGCVLTTPEANARVLTAMVGTPLVLVGQAHSHPGHKVRHSRFDDEHTFARHEGALSVVVPYFGRRGIKVNRCGIHRYINGQFRVVGRRELSQHLVVIPSEKDFRKRKLDDE